jgi:hypothetical protein
MNKLLSAFAAVLLLASVSFADSYILGTNVAAGGGVLGSPRILTFMLGADDGETLVDTNDQATIYWNRTGATEVITEVACESDAGTPTINIARDDGTPANVLSTALTCSTSGATSCASGCDVDTIEATEDDVAAGNKLDLVLVAASTAKRITVVVKLEP